MTRGKVELYGEQSINDDDAHDAHVKLLVEFQRKHYQELGNIAKRLKNPDWSYTYARTASKVIVVKTFRNFEDTPNTRRDKMDDILLKCLIQHKPGKLFQYINKRNRLIADLRIINQGDYERECINNTKLRSIHSKIVEEVVILIYLADTLCFIPGHCRLCVV
ncbi:MAG: hypothetical protein WC455_22070 [Dehalococcoidia bacterium]|jgi:hypothetical protein